jgi:DNA-binding transcriptional ArsR family regulator
MQPECIRAVLEQFLTSSFETLAETFGVLSDPNRARLISALRETSEMFEF